MKFIQVAERALGRPRIVSVQVVWVIWFISVRLPVLLLSSYSSVSLSLSSCWLQGLCTSHFLRDRTHTACFVELLILEWLSAVIMRGSSCVYINILIIHVEFKLSLSCERMVKICSTYTSQFLNKIVVIERTYSI